MQRFDIETSAHVTGRALITDELPAISAWQRDPQPAAGAWGGTGTRGAGDGGGGRGSLTRSPQPGTLALLTALGQVWAACGAVVLCPSVRPAIRYHIGGGGGGTAGVSPFTKGAPRPLRGPIPWHSWVLAGVTAPVQPWDGAGSGTPQERCWRLPQRLVGPVPPPHGCSPPLPSFGGRGLSRSRAPHGSEGSRAPTAPLPAQALPAARRSGAGHVRQVLWLLRRNCSARG